MAILFLGHESCFLFSARHLNVRHNALISLDSLCLLNHTQHLLGVRNRSFVFIENDSHLFEGMTTRFRISEVNGEQADNKDADEDNVVLPCDAVEGDWVDEDIEQKRGVGRKQDDGETSGAEGKWPDLSDVGDEQRREGDVVAGEEDEEEGNNLVAMYVSSLNVR
jgi:hypothetical protein